MTTIQILKETYENLYAITPILAEFLEEEFKNLSPYQWKENYVEPFLQKTRYFKDWHELSEIDSYYLLELLSYNWKALREKTNSKFFTWNNLNLFIDKKNPNSLIKIRNEIAHPTKDSYTNKDYIIWQNSLEEAAHQLGSSLEKLVEQLHITEKQKLLDFLFENTTYKTLKSPDLPPDIRASILNTKDRLEALPTAEAVMSFLRDAQKANRGQHIRDTLKKLNCPTFDEYLPKLEEMYKGMSEI
ncbi:MAG: hypothetical protein IJR39_01820 [Treponema sp.]|nr:hypothetical protein [Treponema sp.]